ncbi:hypothetical protein [Vibrio brasiliensis]|uniref:hypothetical protein n=1 Tax=Vibrio brasiliensis TaxID=170652 RepID=UPI001EFE8149|nr:hypothetical protein [Vibrio brasiliensis]MCG9725702.1 hypothetical protein [Vibrio brasiliensis]
MTTKMSLKYAVFILLSSISVFLLWGAIGASTTTFNVSFKADYEEGRKEILRLKFNNFKGQLTYLGFNNNQEVVETIQFNGWFLRWGDYYFFPSTAMQSPLQSQYFDIKTFHIEKLKGNNYVLLSHRRGVYMYKGLRSLDLKGIFISQGEL